MSEKKYLGRWISDNDKQIEMKAERIENQQREMSEVLTVITQVKPLKEYIWFVSEKKNVLEDG